MFAGMFPLSDDEKSLSNIEQSWADCSNGFRTGNRLRRDTNSVRCFSLLQVHELLEVHHSNYINGDQSALLWALGICLQENLPLPYWCADGVLDCIEKVKTEPRSLHDLFGLSKQYPASGKKATTWRKREASAVELWRRVWEIKSSDKSLSKEAAINAVRKQYFQGISQRTARTYFDLVERNQAKFRKALSVRFGGLKF